MLLRKGVRILIPTRVALQAEVCERTSALDSTSLFSLAQPFTAGNRPIELQARFIGLPIMLKLKRESKPDESGSNALSAAPQP